MSKQAPSESLQALIDDLWTWGPRARSACEAAYGIDTIRQATKREMILTKQVGHIRVYVLTGRGLREFGYAKRYNYVPAPDTIKATMLMRYVLHQLKEQGYTDPVRYEGYAAGLQNIVMLKKDGQMIAVVARTSMTMRTMYNILAHFASLEGQEQPARLQFYVANAMKEHVENGKVIKGYPIEVQHVPISQVKTLEAVM
ncbi:hypothetical protein [Deinococcus aquaedulcis]|uniref:hypothetical protein n=1 Tax=Deinococcus aquaedulcis TaxID=2840455 RepID=UPI001C83C3FD|nr:hypothetical protein [Deinococcus aquaedulcis]